MVQCFHMSLVSHVLAWVNAHKFVLLVVVVAIGGAVYVATRPAPVPSFDTAPVIRGDVVQEVSVTGRVESVASVNLAFERTGRVVAVSKDVGDRVKTGDTLVRLDAAELAAQLAQARANLDYEKAKLAELQRGVRAEEVAVSEAQVAQSRAAEDDAAQALRDKLADTYTKADDAIRNRADHLLRNPATIDPQVDFTMTDGKLETAIESGRVALGKDLRAWNTLRDDIQNLDPKFASDETKRYLDATRSYLENLAQAVNTLLPNSSQTQTTIDSWKLDLSTARTNVNAAATAVVAADTSYRSAQSALRVAEEGLALKKAGALPEAVRAQEARIVAQQGAITNITAQLEKYVLVAPLPGVVTKQDAKLGASVAAGVSLVSIQSAGAYKIEANIPEVDIGKVKVGDTARVTLDAYGEDVVFAATVASIDPAETIIEGVPTYKATLRFDKEDERIRSGMTANTDILTAKREGVLKIPSRAVTSRDDGKFVRIPATGPDGIATTTEVMIQTGLRGSDGSVEVLSGLTEGQEVVTFEK